MIDEDENMDEMDDGDDNKDKAALEPISNQLSQPDSFEYKCPVQSCRDQVWRRTGFRTESEL